VRQLPDKANCIGQQQSLPGRKLNTPRSRIQSRKKLVFDEHLRTGEFIQQSRFAGVRVADDRATRNRQTHPLLPLRRPVGTNELQIFFQTINPASNQPAVRFKLSFAFALASQFASLAVKVTPRPG